MPRSGLGLDARAADRRGRASLLDETAGARLRRRDRHRRQPRHDRRPPTALVRPGGRIVVVGYAVGQRARAALGAARARGGAGDRLALRAALARSSRRSGSWPTGACEMVVDRVLDLDDAERGVRVARGRPRSSGASCCAWRRRRRRDERYAQVVVRSRRVRADVERRGDAVDATLRIGERLAYLRAKRRLKISQLARRISVSPSLISQIERGPVAPVGHHAVRARAGSSRCRSTRSSSDEPLAVIVRTLPLGAGREAPPARSPSRCWPVWALRRPASTTSLRRERAADGRHPRRRPLGAADASGAPRSSSSWSSSTSPAPSRTRSSTATRASSACS